MKDFEPLPFQYKNFEIFKQELEAQTSNWAIIELTVVQSIFN